MSLTMPTIKKIHTDTLDGKEAITLSHNASRCFEFVSRTDVKFSPHDGIRIVLFSKNHNLES